MTRARALAAVVLLLSEGRGQVSYTGKCKVSNSSTESDSQEEPAIVGHCKEHEYVSQTHLEHM